MAAGDLRRRILLTSSSSKIFLTPHTQNLINSAVLPIGMIFLQITVNLLLVFRLRKAHEVEALVAVEEMGLRHLEVELQAPSHISTSKTNRHSHLLTIKLPLFVEVAVSLGEEGDRGVDLHMLREVVSGAYAVVLLGEVIRVNVVVEGAGGIGIRFFSLYMALWFYMLLMLYSEQPNAGVFGGHFSSVVHARRN